MEGKSDPFGRDAIRPLDIPVRGWWQVAERVLSESSRDNLSVVAAGCAFYALFAIFPALSALVSLYGLVADPADIEQSFGMLEYVLPQQAYDIVVEQIRRVAQASGQTLGWSLLLSLGLALWSANSLAQALFAALNIAYEEPERRSLFQFYLSAFTFTLLGILGGLVMLYRFGPCRKNAKWRWVSVGSLFATAVWLLALAGFSFYVSHFANYDKTYGSL